MLSKLCKRLCTGAVHSLLRKRDDLRGRIKAVMPAHLYGMVTADMVELVELAGEQGWKMIEDASQAHGATLQIGHERYYAGTMSDIGTFSMSGVKNAEVA
jgi:dTDP-4-amino-4,6-dideoxygalactose transaminase